MHKFLKPVLIAAALGGAAAAGGCADDRGYGYTGVSLGYGSSWGDPYWGWYDSYYYPGTGIYIYDNNRRRHRWDDRHRRHWEQRRSSWRGDRRWRNNWRDFRRRR